MSAARVFFPLALLATGACQAGPAAGDGASTADDGGQTTEDGGQTTDGGGATSDGGEAPMTDGGASTTDDGPSTTGDAGSTESGGGPLGCDPAGEIPLPDTGNLYFVDAANGSDNNSGNEAEPLETIQEGINRAAPGDTIVLRGGTYAQGVRFRNSGEPGKPITLRNYPGEIPVVDNENKGNAIVVQPTNYSEGEAIGWITIDGIEVKNGNKNIELINVHDIVITRSYIHDSTGQGITGNGTRVLIDGNVVADCGDFIGAQEHGIYCTGTFWTISNNLLYRNAFWGIQVAGYDEASYEVPGPEYLGASDLLIVNNTFAFQHNRSGIVMYAGAENSVIQNNIFYNNSTDYPNSDSGVSFYGSGGGNQVINNLHVGPYDFISDSDPDDIHYTETGTIDGEDPLFVDADGLDFHLQENSPAKDQGVATDAPATDFEGRPRPQGAGPDMGAFETCE